MKFLKCLSLAVGLVCLIGCVEPEKPKPPQGPQYELAYMSEQDEGRLEIFITDFANTYARKLFGNDQMNPYGISWTPDGEGLIFCTLDEGSENVFWLNIRSNSLQQLTDFKARDYGAKMSPTGKEVVFVSERASAAGEIYILRLQDSVLNRLTTNSDYDTSPAFSPNGQAVAFCRIIPGEAGGEGNGEIMAIDTDGQNERRLTNKAGFDCMPDWSPDSQTIAFHGCDEKGCQIYSVPAIGGQPFNLTNDEHDNRWPRWSPDGKWIAYTSVREGQTDIYVMRPDGSGKKQVTTSPGRDEIAEWRPKRKVKEAS